MGKKSVVPPIAFYTCLIALGSNLDFEDDVPSIVLDRALAKLEARGFVIRKRSRNFTTPAFPAGAGPDFVNAAVMAETAFDADEVLAHLHAVEAEMGRARAVRWGARTVDLDLIAVDAQVLPDAQTHQYWRQLPLEVQKTTAPTQLILPHPRLAERAFVLVPLLDVAPQWQHPVTGMTVQQMHDALPAQQRAEIVAQ
ncbi:2-amino-4-hydroxy-6-hydroxymethyldihydropteridine diphosphokinase [Sulfitobacter sp. F26169L]|uniref:2-amino-4-hydroxy-6- hydroxymethyldihydropteridine diphosphokinase n=1 Tax=Sulfitobacter sp. F26169L TaxID=2996015 RepID=UPI002260E261|nr:2-amino-4-hydroxy-6-hydroxymethyldihydropteridine diphosphokinase [Sulfitobacter sp. F26169L]MCX7566765.1 2-amino-4-hydroxy-6-hydroxymethyldihydropteridine diphosphokinase [Sulfitobacter sp. F26169L]